VSVARRFAALLIVVSALAGCGGSGGQSSLGLPGDYRPIPAGRGARFRLPALSAAASRGVPISGLACTRHHPHAFAIHLELYGRGLVLPIPSGIGIAPPVRRSGAYVRAGRCGYPIRTLEPTGLVLVDPHRRLTVGDLFAIWGQQLGRTRLAGFSGPLLAYVDGHRWRGAPEQIPLRRHAQIVLEADGYVPPHPSYTFPPGR
jgi:hypothetical protein